MKPPSHFDIDSTDLLRQALERLQSEYAGLPSVDRPTRDTKAIAEVLLEVASRMGREFPYFHPLYAGQMLKPPHPVARLAYALSMWINPNNHALDGGRASSVMEAEAVAQLARLAGYSSHLGHLTSGGTMANLEALWIAGQLTNKSVILASDQAHYTQGRISAVLGLPFEPVASDRNGRLDMVELEKRLAKGDVGTVVATLGTTATGSVDPLPDILKLRSDYRFRLHVDAAYGGYFTLADNLESAARSAFDLMGAADSIVIDPHKHGLQPYGCGCVLFRDPAVGTLYKHDSPYTYFTSRELHLGEISLECSRPGAAAVALWATQRLLPLEKGGTFGAGLTAGRSAAIALHRRMEADKRFVTPFAPELDILTWTVRAKSCSEASTKSRRVFEAAARSGLHLALAELPAAMFEYAGMLKDRATVTSLRSVLMKPEHFAWEERIWRKIDEAMNA